MIKTIGNKQFYKTLAEKQIVKISERNRTSLATSKRLLENNQRLCNEINMYNKANNTLDSFIYCLDSAGNFIKKIKNATDVFVVNVSDNEIIKFIEKIRKIK